MASTMPLPALLENSKDKARKGRPLLCSQWSSTLASGRRASAPAIEGPRRCSAAPGRHWLWWNCLSCRGGCGGATQSPEDRFSVIIGKLKVLCLFLIHGIYSICSLALRAASVSGIQRHLSALKRSAPLMFHKPQLILESLDHS